MSPWIHLKDTQPVNSPAVGQILEDFGGTELSVWEMLLSHQFPRCSSEELPLSVDVVDPQA